MINLVDMARGKSCRRYHHRELHDQGGLLLLLYSVLTATEIYVALLRTVAEYVVSVSGFIRSTSGPSGTNRAFDYLCRHCQLRTLEGIPEARVLSWRVRL